MVERLTIKKQQQIIEKRFQKLKDKFLTKEQSSMAHLAELPEHYWLINDP
jgi:hypothetical protein